jgi:hypothetical protein
MNSFSSFLSQYDLPPVRGYTFLGTESSVDKPVMRFDGKIRWWFDPRAHVPWIAQAIEVDRFDVKLVDGYLPAVNVKYHNPHANETCEMTAFAADRGSAGAIHLYVRLVETAEGTRKATRHFRLRDRAVIDGATFEAELQKLRERWTRFFEQAAPITCDDPMVLDACKASIIRALITFTGKHPHYGVVMGYDEVCHDSFPPAVIALVDCLIDWGHAEKARGYLEYYLKRFVTDTGHFDYYGPTLAEYGQMLRLVRRLVDALDEREWLEGVRPRLERMCDWIWKQQSESETGLITGVPEADLWDRPTDVYLHTNAWCWRGLCEISSVLNRPGARERCNAYRRAILDTIDEVTDRTCDPAFIPPVARRMAPFQTMTQDLLASLTNYRYWPELLSSGILSVAQMQDIVRYRVGHGGEASGLTRYNEDADNWPIAEYARGLLDMGKKHRAQQVMRCHLAGHQTPETWTAYESVTLKGEPHRNADVGGPWTAYELVTVDGQVFRKHDVGGYCVVAQLVAPRILAWLWHVGSEGLS